MTTINQLLLTFLLNACWQVVIVAGLAALCDALLPKKSPRYRHTLWVAALVLGFCLPMLTCSWLLWDVLSAPAISAAPVEPGSIATVLTTPSVTESSAAISMPFIFRLGANVALTLVACYLLVVLYRAIKLFVAWRRTRAIARSGYDASLPEAARSAIAKCSAIGVANMSILFSASTPGPVTIGNSKPLIILPEELLDETDENVFVSAIGHEMVHISRRDYVFNLIYELIFLPLSFHPAATLVRRRINHTRELCCDEKVAGRLLQAEDYARSLVKLAGSATGFGQPVLTTTVGMGDADNLEVRIMSLLKKSESTPRRKNVILVAGLLIVAVIAVIAGGFGVRVGVDEVSAQKVEKPDKEKEIAEMKAALLRENPNMSEQELKEKIKTLLARGYAERLDGNLELMERREKEIAEMKAAMLREHPDMTDEQFKKILAERLSRPNNDQMVGIAEFERASALDQVKLAREARISMEQAIQAATAAHPGTVMSSRLTKEKNTAMYRIVVIDKETSDGNITYTLVLVSGADGQIVKTEKGNLKQL